jgi:hypothetical protein
MIIVSKGGAYVVFIQEMQREVAKERAVKKTKIAPLIEKTLKAEHFKCAVTTPHLFVIITDEAFDSSCSELKNNEIVLSSNMHSAAIGPLLTLLRKLNHAHQPQKMTLTSAKTD